MEQNARHEAGAGLVRNMLSDVAYDALKERIISLDLSPGARLNLDRLASEFGISQTPIREALSRLVAENLVRLEPFKGFSVEPLLSLDELYDLLEVRILLETHAAVRAVGRLSEEDFVAMRHQVQLMDDLIRVGKVDVRAFNTADAAFHQHFVAAAENPILAQTYASLNVHIRIARLFQRRTLNLAEQANGEHHEILSAFEDKDIKLVTERVASHIRAVQNRLRMVLSSGDEVGEKIT